MEDFKSFSSSKKEQPKNMDKNLTDLISSLVGKYNGKDEKEILSAILKEAEKGKKNGTLKNEDIDNFSKMLSPFLDTKQKEALEKVVKKLKKL